MNDNIKKAIELLNINNCTFAAVNGEAVITSVQRGIKPLLELYEAGHKLHGYSAADKVIGKAAAFLYVLLEPDSIYTNVISRSALKVLEDNNINVTFNVLAEAIRNRDNTGYCPMETAVSGTDDPIKALGAIYQKM